MTSWSSKASRHRRNKSSAEGAIIVEQKRCSTIDREAKSLRDDGERNLQPTPRADAHGADVGERLQRTIEILFEDAARVELWACALSGFAQPVPD
jgi:hypothetical protein